MFDTIIRNARLIRSDLDEVGDVAIREGRIAAIGDISQTSAQNEIDARGLVLMSGVIDTQVHFREPGMEHKEDLESGTRAAITGGVTAILEMPNTNPTTTTEEALLDKLERASGRAWCDYGFFVGAATDNIDQLGRLETLPGVPGIKIFVGSSTGSLLVDAEEDLLRVFRSGHKRCPVHAEDETRNRERRALLSESPHPREHPFLRDEESARIATERIIRIAGEADRPVHILHVTTRQEPLLIAAAKGRGQDVTAEVTPQHLYFSAPDCYEKLGTLAQMNPPIRSREHTEALWRALAEGVFDVFGSDHAPHTLEEKAKPYPASPSGMPGVQTMLPLLLTFAAQGRLSLQLIAEMACEKPAELYGMLGKGKLDLGYDADLVLVDPKRSYIFERRMVQSKCGWSSYEGEPLTGSIEHVFLRGHQVVYEGELVGSPIGEMLHFA
ncbi:MAG TPA: dihydroorotase [Fimbriimonas sp.]|nr:dihydroorotase [Fimbriimonas sp.]